METLKAGIMSAEDFKKRTMDIAQGNYKPKKDEPKVWFQSIETFSQVLSSRNQELLIMIAKTKPRSMSELASQSHRHLSNLSRTLKTMERYGIVYFERHLGKEVAPRVHYSNVELEFPLR